MPSKRFAALLEQHRTLHAEASKLTEKETRTDEEQARLDAIMGADDEQGELDKVVAEIDRFKKLQDTERTAPASEERALATVRERIEDDPKRGFRDIGQFAVAVKQLYTPGSQITAAPTNFHFETGSDEGAMVPPAFKQEILEAVTTSDGSLLGAVDSEATGSNSVEFIRDESTPWGATGVQANWRAEGAQMSASKLATALGDVKLHELYAYVLATEELLEDAPRLADRLTRKAGLALTYKVNEAIVNGTGAGQPQGWFTGGSLVTVAKEGSQAAATILAANVAKMYARLINPGQGVWYVNQDALPQLFTMTVGDQPVWIPPTGIGNAPTGGFLFGRPVQTLENCATLGTVGDIQFVNPKGYYAAIKQGGAKFAESMHLFFDYGMQAFRWTLRLGGQPYLSAAVSPAKGSSTRSHFVALATRS